MSTQQRTFEVLKDPTGEKTEDVTVNIESHPDYNRVVHATCAETSREAKIGIEGTKAEPRRSRCTATYPSGSSPSCGASVFARFAKAATPINKYQDPEQRGEHGKPYPVTTMRHNPLHRLDSTEIPAVSIAIPISIPITIPIAVPRIEPPRARCWRNVCAHDDTRRQDYSERRHATVGVRRRHY